MPTLAVVMIVFPLNCTGAVKADEDAQCKLFRLLLAVNAGLDNDELVAAQPRHHVADATPRASVRRSS